MGGLTRFLGSPALTVAAANCDIARAAAVEFRAVPRLREFSRPAARWPPAVPPDQATRGAFSCPDLCWTPSSWDAGITSPWRSTPWNLRHRTPCPARVKNWRFWPSGCGWGSRCGTPRTATTPAMIRRGRPTGGGGVLGPDGTYSSRSVVRNFHRGGA